jgi:Cu/Zn superoxide dismutase
MTFSTIVRYSTFIALLGAATALPAAAQTAKATLKTADGKEAGAATLTQTPSGVLIALSVKNLPAAQ